MRNSRHDAWIRPRAPPGSGRDEAAQLRIEGLVAGSLFLAGPGEWGWPFRIPLVVEAKLFGQEHRDALGFVGRAVAYGACCMGPERDEGCGRQTDLYVADPIGEQCFGFAQKYT
jgi:hypothetical protein